MKEGHKPDEPRESRRIIRERPESDRFAYYDDDATNYEIYREESDEDDEDDSDS